ncbi:hypothetical protein BDN72DRAFT_880404 [Pluteus cervinus]|uniref:Uncharacterized protein n=1 Tax=Pluteus cervinus TaxID=181527 RepID=A0ACD3AMZ2_9AGAR|nr:hypothetical protein BDN72DRAFT_880404 [Pluteus cervinus]
MMSPSHFPAFTPQVTKMPMRHIIIQDDFLHEEDRKIAASKSYNLIKNIAMRREVDGTRHDLRVIILSASPTHNQLQWWSMEESMRCVGCQALVCYLITDNEATLFSCLEKLQMMVPHNIPVVFTSIHKPYRVDYFQLLNNLWTGLFVNTVRPSRLNKEAIKWDIRPFVQEEVVKPTRTRPPSRKQQAANSTK